MFFPLLIRGQLTSAVPFANRRFQPGILPDRLALVYLLLARNSTVWNLAKKYTHTYNLEEGVREM